MAIIFCELDANEAHLIKDFTYEAIYVPEGMDPPPREIVDRPELSIYYEDFGAGVADHAFAAQVEDQVVGIAWSRIMDDYGHVDDDTPSLGIAVRTPYRGQGIGGRLLMELLTLLRHEGYRQVSLSVQSANRARMLYERIGFKTIAATDEELIMTCRL